MGHYNDGKSFLYKRNSLMKISKEKPIYTINNSFAKTKRLLIIIYGYMWAV